jgi:hypothetical protein
MLRQLIFLSLTELQKMVNHICGYHRSYAVGALSKCYRILHLTNQSLERVYYHRILLPKLKTLKQGDAFYTSLLCVLYVASNLDTSHIEI